MLLGSVRLLDVGCRASNHLIIFMNPPDRARTERLLIRRWRPGDAAPLKDAVDASLAHLQAWMPWAMAEPTPLAELETRLAGFAADFEAGLAWLYGIFPPDEHRVLGGLGLHPQAASPGGAGDVVELGYWLRADATGHGYATEAARAGVDLAGTLPGIRRVEIRCDPRNAPSAGVPRRLGFRQVRTLPDDRMTPEGAPRDSMVWEREVGRPWPPAAS
jgi:RimJ/RimL family protein N-acetyltransferase